MQSVCFLFKIYTNFGKVALIGCICLGKVAELLRNSIG